MRYITLFIACGLASAFFFNEFLYAQSQTPTIQTEQQPTSGLDVLIDDYKQKREARTAYSEQLVDKAGQLLRLQSQLIDLRVERDQLEMHVQQLESRLQEVTVIGASSKCKVDECVPVREVEKEKIALQVTHAVHLYAYGKTLYDIESCDKTKMQALNMMLVALDDLELLGFDTTDLLEKEDFSDLLAHRRDLTEKASQR